MTGLLSRRVPVVLQMSPVECGAACLAMLLGYFGRKTRIAECRDRLGLGRDGATAQNIARAARSYGFRVRSFSIEPQDLTEFSLPVIAHWNFNHFVVIERCSPDKIGIVDPAFGRRTVAAAEFDAAFTGIVLVLEPGDGFEPATPKPVCSSWIARLLTGPAILGILVQILVASAPLQFFGLAVPLFTKALVDTVLPHRLHDLLSIAAIGIVLLVAAQAVTAYLRSVLLLRLQARLDSQIMLGFFEHVLSLPFAFFQQRTSGDLLMRLTSNITIREALTNQLLAGVIDGAFVLVYFGVLMAMDMRFAGTACLLALAQIAVLVLTGRRLRQATQEDLVAAAESQTYLIEALSGVASLKASGAEDRALEHWSNLFFRHLHASLRKGNVSSTVGTLLMTLRLFSTLLLLWLAALRVLDGEMSLGMMLAVNALAASFLMPLGSLVANAQQLYLVRAHLDRVSDVLAAEPERRHPNSAPVHLRGGIELRHVDFRYHSSGALVLHDLNLVVEPGQKIALVGRTGSGKSTLAKLLLGLHRPSAGEVLYDGMPLDRMDLVAVRRQMGIVLQEPWLFSGSIRQNITFHTPCLPLASVFEAARIAEVHDDVARFPMGYETVLIEGGVALSGGQRQRIAIARALVHKPRILVMDEATSHLDAITESRVERNLGSLHCTRMVIAHRLSTIMDADLIVVLDNGSIVEQGTHAQLMSRDGHYAAMVRNQVVDGRAVYT